MKVNVMFTTELKKGSNMTQVDFWNKHTDLCYEMNEEFNVDEHGHNGSYGCYFTEGSQYSSSDITDLSKSEKRKIKQRGYLTYEMYDDKDVVFLVSFYIDKN